MTSLTTMLTRIHGLVGTTDLSDWESKFVASVWEQTKGGRFTANLSEKQVERIESIFEKHFAG